MCFIYISFTFKCSLYEELMHRELAKSSFCFNHLESMLLGHIIITICAHYVYSNDTIITMLLQLYPWEIKKLPNFWTNFYIETSRIFHPAAPNCMYTLSFSIMYYIECYLVVQTNIHSKRSNLICENIKIFHITNKKIKIIPHFK